MKIRCLLLRTLLALGLPWITGAGSSALAESIQPLPRENGNPPFPGKKSNWEGYDRYDFTVDGRECYVVVPPRALPGKPWIWRARFPEWHPEPDLMLLEIGFHVAYMDVVGLYGSPEAVAHFDAFYDFLTRRRGLSPKTTPIGISRGGLAVYNWAKKNPEKVDSIYCESPVCDFKSWPGGKGKGIASAEDWGGVLKAYGFTEEQALAYRDNPIDNLEALARAKVPILHVIGANDRVVPPAENTYLLKERYEKLGGAMAVHVNTKGPETLDGHHFSLDDPVLVVNFIARDRPSLRLNENEGATDPYGRPYFELRGGLENCRVRFTKQKEGRVAFLGGSITYNPGWRTMTMEYLQKQFPETGFDFISAGIPSMGSTPGAFRMQRDVLARGPVDLLFEEAAVNDATNEYPPVEMVRGMEGIVRQALEANPNMDIILLHFVDPDKMREYRLGKTPDVIRSHEKVAEHYQVPSINLALEVTHRIMAGEFTWEKDFVDLHPSPFGQRIYFNSIQRLFADAWRKSLPDDAAIRPHRIPAAPLDPASYYHGRLTGVDQAVLEKGWKLDPNWSPRDGKGTREGFVQVPMVVAEQPGAVLRFKFEGTAVGVFVAAGPDAGIIAYSVDGKPYRERDLFTQWSPGLHLPWAHVLEAGLARGPHELALRIADKRNPQSIGNACRIAHFLVNQ